jgi:hypothetical protein
MEAQEKAVRMTHTDLFRDGLTVARDTGHAAAVQAGAHAERVTEGWLARAEALVGQYAGLQGAFLVEDARQYAEACGLPTPPDARAWGAVVQALKRRGVLVFAGYASAQSSNGSPKCLWRRAA